MDPLTAQGMGHALRDAHVRDYQQLFNRVTLDLGSSKRVPTDERIRTFGGGTDPGLAARRYRDRVQTWEQTRHGAGPG